MSFIIWELPYTPVPLFNTYNNPHLWKGKLGRVHYAISNFRVIRLLPIRFLHYNKSILTEVFQNKLWF
jgi:hypothetical protein